MSEKDNIEKLMSDKGMQFRKFSISKMETRANEDGQESLLIEGEPVVFNSETELFAMDKNSYCEVIDAKAFDECDMTDVILNQNHCGRVYARTRNNSLKLGVKDDGLHMSAELWADDEGHKELYRDIKRGNMDKMSFAFTVAEDEYESTESGGVIKHLRTIKKIDHLYDVSVVDIPAYDSTSISARKAFDAESERREAESRAAESRKRALKLKIQIRKELMK